MCDGVERVAVKYHYYVSLGSMRKILMRLEYDPDKMFMIDGYWDIQGEDVYVDNVPFKSVNRITGIGFFSDYSNDLPDLVFNDGKQEIYILGERHCNELAQVHDTSRVYSIRLPYHCFFSKDMTWQDYLHQEL